MILVTVCHPLSSFWLLAAGFGPFCLSTVGAVQIWGREWDPFLWRVGAELGWHWGLFPISCHLCKFPERAAELCLGMKSFCLCCRWWCQEACSLNSLLRVHLQDPCSQKVSLCVLVSTELWDGCWEGQRLEQHWPGHIFLSFSPLDVWIPELTGAIPFSRYLLVAQAFLSSWEESNLWRNKPEQEKPKRKRQFLQDECHQDIKPSLLLALPSRSVQGQGCKSALPLYCFVLLWVSLTECSHNIPGFPVLWNWHRSGGTEVFMPVMFFLQLHKIHYCVGFGFFYQGCQEQSLCSLTLTVFSNSWRETERMKKWSFSFLKVSWKGNYWVFVIIPKAKI